jgi:hypothetical protein
MSQNFTVREIVVNVFTQYTHQLLSIILCSTLVNFYILVILYGELLLKKAAIYGVKKDELWSV